MEEIPKAEEATAKKRSPWLYIKAAVILLAGYWAYYEGANFAGLYPIIICFFLFLLLIYMLARFLVTKDKERRRKNKAQLGFSFLVFLALVAGLVIGGQIVYYQVENSKKEAGTVIKALENYYKSNNRYPETLQELGIPIPKLPVGGELSYRVDTYMERSVQAGSHGLFFM